MFYVYLALENGVSQATRYGVTGNLKDDPANPGTALNRVDSIKLAMRQADAHLDPRADCVHCLPTRAAAAVGPAGSAGLVRSRSHPSTTRGGHFLTPLASGRSS